MKHSESGFLVRYREWYQKNYNRFFMIGYRTLSIVVCVLMISILLLVVVGLPAYGSEDNPTNNEVADKYREDGVEDTGAVNLVAAVILDYRAFDTFGESAVLFIAAGSVMILLSKKRTGIEEKLETEEEEDIILKTTSKILVPFILLYGVYVIINGHISPGGGFAGGSIMGAGLILYYIGWGKRNTKRFFTFSLYKKIVFSAFGFYACAKSYSFYTGANHIESIIPKGIAGNILSGGLILPLNICVGLIVMCTMFGFYLLFVTEEI